MEVVQIIYSLWWWMIDMWVKLTVVRREEDESM
jgi:hypothetical protein